MVSFISFTDIMLLPAAAAFKMVSRDTWFAQMRERDSTQRYVSHRIHNNKVVMIEVGCEPRDGCVQVDKTLDMTAIAMDTPLTEGEFAAVLFSCFQNWGPLKALEDFCEPRFKERFVFVSSLSEPPVKWQKAYLGFCAHVGLGECRSLLARLLVGKLAEKRDLPGGEDEAYFQHGGAFSLDARERGCEMNEFYETIEAECFRAIYASLHEDDCAIPDRAKILDELADDERVVQLFVDLHADKL